MAKAKGGSRPIRFDQFEQQLEETGTSNMQEIILSKDDSIWIRLGNSIDLDDAESFQDRMKSAEDSKEVALVVLDYKEGVTAEEQWDLYESYGGTADKLSLIFRAATSEQQERLGNLRPRRS